jgi:holliday junction DNA helicase RuvA
MIAFLCGILIQKSPEHVVINVNGVGYRVHVPLSTFYDLGDINEEVCLNIHTHVREDLIHLYGFLSTLEKDMFLRLIEVTKIGPKLALSILSGIPAEDLRSAIWAGDVGRLGCIKGVGKKTSERIVMELRDKLRGAESAFPAVTGYGRTESDVMGDAISALMNLGYNQKEADAAIKRLAKDGQGEDLSLENLIKEALKKLMR